MPVASALANVDLFAGLTATELEELSARSGVRHYGKGTVLFLQGDPGTCLYVVLTGRVKIVRASREGKEMVIAVRGPGDVFGDMALLDGEPRSADAVTMEACRLVVLWRADFVHFLEAHPAIGVRLLAMLSRRLRQTMQQQEEAAFQDVGTRVASALLRLVEASSAAPGDGEDGERLAVATTITQAELAGMVGITRESVNKWIQFYERRGLIEWTKGRLTVLRPAELRRRVS